jgi:uncharacterized protein
MRSPEEILAEARTIAIVGASPRPERASHGVMRYLLEHGYRVIPVRPRDCAEAPLAVPSIRTRGSSARPSEPTDRPAGIPPSAYHVLGVPCAVSLAEIEEPIDVVDVFRRADACPDVAREAVAAGAKAVWLQLGLVSPEARKVATEAGLDYVEDACTAVVHRRL